MFDFIDDIKLKVRQSRELRQRDKVKAAELKLLEDEKQHEITKKVLDREIDIEEKKAKIRKQQAIALPKPGQKIPEKKSGFDVFQDYCTDFANKQQSGQSLVGEIKMGGLNGKNTKRRF